MPDRLRLARPCALAVEHAARGRPVFDRSRPPPYPHADRQPLPTATFTVAESDGAIAGALTGRLIPLPYERGDSADLPDVYAPLLELEAVAGLWYLNVVAVYPEFRGQGLGSALLSKAKRLRA